MPIREAWQTPRNDVLPVRAVTLRTSSLTLAVRDVVILKKEFYWSFLACGIQEAANGYRQVECNCAKPKVGHRRSSVRPLIMTSTRQHQQCMLGDGKLLILNSFWDIPRYRRHSGMMKYVEVEQGSICFGLVKSFGPTSDLGGAV